MINSMIHQLERLYSPFERNNNPFYVLIFTILSQRTKDEITEVSADRLFSKYKNAEQLSKAKVKDVEKLIKPVGFYHVKAKRIIETAKIILNKYKGKVPDSLEELTSIKGVGRKTANCVLVYVYNISTIPVDTHVHRISNRIGLVKTRIPKETEAELKRIIPKKYWIKLNYLFVKHGKKICRPVSPKCSECTIKKYCIYGKTKE